MSVKVRPRKDDDEFVIDPVYQALARINGSINRMNKSQLQIQLSSLNLSQKGVKEVLQRRLKNHYKKQKLKLKPETGQCYPYLVVIDFEATCEESNPPQYLHEIIEFPAILIDTEAVEIKDAFQSYCRPTLNPTLSDFCVELTGIQQSQVDDAPHFPLVFEKFESWLKGHDLLTARRCAFVTDGSWDFSRFLNVQCCLSDVKYPKWAKKWINLKKIYGNFYKLKRPRMLDMLSNIGLEFEGRHHCGFDDAKNFARIVVRMLQDGAQFQVNERLRSGKLEIISEKERELITCSNSAKIDLEVDVVNKLVDLRITDNESSTSLN